MNPAIDSITSKLGKITDKLGKVDALITVSAGALKSVEDGDVESALAVVSDYNSAAIEGLDEIQTAVNKLTINKTNGIPREKIKNLSRDTGEIYHLLTMIIDSMKADQDLNANYENSLSGVKKLMAKAHSELFELGGGAMINSAMVGGVALEPRQRNQSLIVHGNRVETIGIAADTTTIVFLFASILRSDPMSLPTLKRVAATCEHEARRQLVREYVLVFAGRVVGGEP